MKKQIELTPQQKKIAEGKGLFVVKACPGSGKTFAVAARIAHLLKRPESDFHFNGIAALSFTNVAYEEIQTKLEEDFEIPVPLKFPNFIGTIDSFINKYIFLPYGHLFMNCNKRPEHIGHPFSYWDEFDISLRKYGYKDKSGKSKISQRDPYEYFDKVTFNKKDKPIPNYRSDFFPFSWNKLYKKNGDYIKVIQDIIEAKQAKFKEGKATQSDANYIAYKVLCNYEKIVENIEKRFSYFIIDEAQDTTDVQMAIIDILVDKGAKEMVLIGDPDQAIFEWNDAKPEQFEEKYNKWEKSKDFQLLENRRSSKLICTCTRKFLSISEYDVIGDDENYDFKPKVIGHNRDQLSLEKIRDDFLQTCYERKIDKFDKDGNYNIAILYRSHSIGDWLGIPNPEKHDTPWRNGHYHVRDITQGKYFLENGELRKGFKMLERGYHKLMGNFKHVTNEYIRNEITKHGFKEYRTKIFEFVDLLPTTLSQDLKLKDWKNAANKKMAQIGKKLEIDENKSYVSYDELFKNSKERKHPDYFIGTIHSAKGKTFEAVLIVLDKRFGNKSNYINIIKYDYFKLAKATDKEEMRTVYVAMTRPRKILMIAVPEEDCKEWQKKLGL